MTDLRIIKKLIREGEAMMVKKAKLEKQRKRAKKRK